MQDEINAKIFMKSHIIIGTIKEGGIASRRGLNGNYSVLSFADWTIETDSKDFFKICNEMKDNPITLTFYKDGEIREEYFEDKIGIDFYIEKIEEQKKQKIIKVYRKLNTERLASKDNWLKKLLKKFGY